MGKSYYKQFEEIKNDLKNIKNILEQDLIKEAEQDMLKFQKNIVTLFYKSYKPNKYKRKYDLYDIVVDHYARNGVASITIDGDHMYQHGRSKYPISGYDVYNRMWNEGIRGLPQRGVQPLSHSFCFYGKHYEQGQVWTNQFWSGASEPYYNIFEPSIQYGSVNISGKPNILFKKYRDNWWKVQGEKKANKLIRQYFRR